MQRRTFLAAILAAGVAPAIVRAANLMPVRVLDSGLVVPQGWWGVEFALGDRVVVNGVEYRVTDVETSTFRPPHYRAMSTRWGPRLDGRLDLGRVIEFDANARHIAVRHSGLYNP